MTAIPLIHPDRTDTGFRPLKALHHFRKLIADKEDTEQVFHILDALRDNRFKRSVARFFATAEGQKVLADRPYLPAMLDDHDALRKLPEGSVGRVYVDFMEREGLTAQGLVDESMKFRRTKPRFDDMVELYGDRLRDTHDLFHILTGFGRDALGQAGGHCSSPGRARARSARVSAAATRSTVRSAKASASAASRSRSPFRISRRCWPNRSTRRASA